MYLQIAAGGFHAAALTNDGEVYTWGTGRYGVLGHGSGGSNAASPKRVTALRGINIVKVRPGRSLSPPTDIWFARLCIYVNTAQSGVHTLGKNERPVTR